MAGETGDRLPSTALRPSLMRPCASDVRHKRKRTTGRKPNERASHAGHLLGSIRGRSMAIGVPQYLATPPESPRSPQSGLYVGFSAGKF